MEGWRLQNIIFLLWWMKTSFNIIYGWFSNLSIWTILSKEEVIFWFWMRMEKIQNFLFNLKTCHAVAVSYDLGPYQTSWDISSTPIFQTLLQTQFWKMENEFSCDQNPSWWLIQHFPSILETQIEFKMFFESSLDEIRHCVCNIKKYFTKSIDGVKNFWNGVKN